MFDYSIERGYPKAMTVPASVTWPAYRLVDLSQPLGPQTPLWPGGGDFSVKTSSSYEQDGCYDRLLSLPEHIGTHVDAPAHFAPTGFRIDELPLERLVGPALVFDISASCADDPDYLLDADELSRLAADTPIPPKSFVLVRTGWDRHLGDLERYVGRAGTLRFPGLAAECAKLLVERGVSGVGIDTLSVDRGASTDFGFHNISMRGGLIHIEGLVDLDRLPATGSLLVVGCLPLVGGSGSPARVFAFVPGKS
jgi:kynurenine formamidase